MAPLRLVAARSLLAGSLAAAWVSVLLNTWGAQSVAHPRWLSSLVDLGPVLSPPVLVLLTATYAACTGAWVARRAPLWTGGLAFALLGLLGHVENSLYEGDSGVHHGKLLPAVALGAWWVSFALSRRKATSERERGAYDAMLGAAAACYVLAAFAKVLPGGLDWIRSVNLPLLAAERAVGASAPLATLRDAFADAASDDFSPLISTLALAIEFGAIGLLWPRTRRAAASLLLGLHCGIAVLLGYVYVAWMLFLTAVLVERSRSSFGTG